MNILVTGSCGVTSRAIARSLRISEKFGSARLVGTDVCENSFGIYEGLFETTYRVPYVWEDGYADLMKQICEREQIAAAILIPELEVRFWSKREFPCPTTLPPEKFSELVVSKKRLYEALTDTDLVPSFTVLDTHQARESRQFDGRLPKWVRAFDEGSSSGKGALLVKSVDELLAWIDLNEGYDQLLMADVLPGRNLACHLLYSEGKVRKIAVYERLKYFMSRVSPSGITGNICEGKLVNLPEAVEVSTKAIELILQQTGELMSGLVAVDLREDSQGRPRITEINLRHVASTYSFALSGFNLAEAQIELSLDPSADVGELEAQYPENNLILRDIDGIPIWVSDFKKLEIGECFHTPQNS